jgi:hypothetical protein
VAIIQTGANADTELLLELLAGRTPASAEPSLSRLGPPV